MTRRITDIFLIIMSGYFSFQIAVYMVVSSEKIGGHTEHIVFPIISTLFALLIYGVTLQSPKIYNKYRWWGVGILCGLLLISGASVAFRILS